LIKNFFIVPTIGLLLEITAQGIHCIVFLQLLKFLKIHFEATEPCFLEYINIWQTSTYSNGRYSMQFLNISCKEASFTIGVRADVQPKSSIPIGAKAEIGLKGFTLGVKAEIEKIFSINPKLLINAELYSLVLTPRLKKGHHGIWEANLQPLGPMFQHLLIP
jgi:hypothetical protein